jgi:hypothetical protein
VTGLVVLVTAIVIGNTVLAAVAIAIAALGLVLLAIDGRKERETSSTDDAADSQSDEGDSAPPVAGLKPELFTPDVSYEEAVQQTDDDVELDVEGNG